MAMKPIDTLIVFALWLLLVLPVARSWWKREQRRKVKP